MPTHLNDLIQSVVGLAGVQHDREQQALAAQQFHVTGIQQFLNEARSNPDPAMLTGLVKHYAPQGVASEQDLQTILRQTTPTAAAIHDWQVGQGALQSQGLPNALLTKDSQDTAREANSINATGMNGSQRSTNQFLIDAFGMTHPTQAQADQLGSRTATGMDLGKAAVSTAMAGLPASELSQGAGVELGTRMSAAQDAGNQTNWAQNRLGWAQLTANSAAEQFRTEAQLEADIQRIRATHGDDAGKLAQGLIEQAVSLQKAVTESKNNPTSALTLTNIGLLNSIYTRMRQIGMTSVPENIPMDPAAVVEPGLLHRGPFQNRTNPVQTDSTGYHQQR